MKVDRIMIEGKEKVVGNATDAIVHTYNQLLSQHADAGKIKEFMGTYKTILTTEDERKNSTFRSKRLLDVENVENFEGTKGYKMGACPHFAAFCPLQHRNV